MNILVTNDDGIHAPGLNALVETMQELGKISVIAPSFEMSACGHGITVHDPLKVFKKSYYDDITAWAVEGTPADCVKLGITTLLERKPDLVVSGINRGPNLGTDVLYSGTVSAAIESVICGVPAIAFSLNSFNTQDYSLAQEAALFLCEVLMKNKIPEDTLLNVNIPAIDKGILRGYKVTKLGERKYKNVFEKRIDPRENEYYWLKGKIIPPEDVDQDLDVVAVENNYISVTPIHFDLTNYRIMNKIKEWGIEKEGI